MCGHLVCLYCNIFLLIAQYYSVILYICMLLFVVIKYAVTLYVSDDLVSPYMFLMGVDVTLYVSVMVLPFMCLLW